MNPIVFPCVPPGVKARGNTHPVPHGAGGIYVDRRLALEEVTVFVAELMEVNSTTLNSRQR